MKAPLRNHLSAVVATLAMAGCMSLSPERTLEKLDKALAKGDTQEVYNLLRGKSGSSPEVGRWLETRASEGHVVPALELAERLRKTDTAQALKWYARGRMGMLADQRSCTEEGGLHSMFAVMVLDKEYRDLDQLARDKEEEFAAGIDVALQVAGESYDTAPSPQWMCGKAAHILSEGPRMQERAKAIAALRKKREELAPREDEALRKQLLEGITVKQPDPQYRRSLPLAWLDKDRLVIGVDRETQWRPSSRPYVWNVAENTYRPFHEVDEEIDVMCSHDGYVRFTSRNDEGNTYSMYAGPPGKEQLIYKRVGKNVVAGSADDVRYNAWTCRSHDERTERLGKHGIPLLRGDGVMVLVFGKTFEVRLLSEADLSVKAIVRPKDEPYRVRPVFFDGSYIIKPQARPDGTPSEIVQIWPDGRTKTTVIEHKYWSSQLRDYSIAKFGILVSSQVKAHEFKSTWAGVYVVRNGKGARVAKGISGREMFVDSTGCRAAAHLSDKGRENEFETFVIDGCKH